MAKKRSEPVTTRRMPSGAQQYVREGSDRGVGGSRLSDPTQRRLNMINDLIRENPDAEGALHDAFMDEIYLERTARQTEEQARTEGRGRGYASGGMVRGHRSTQRSGTKFQGTF